MLDARTVSLVEAAVSSLVEARVPLVEAGVSLVGGGVPARESVGTLSSSGAGVVAGVVAPVDASLGALVVASLGTLVASSDEVDGDMRARRAGRALMRLVDGIMRGVDWLGAGCSKCARVVVVGWNLVHLEVDVAA